MVETESSKKPPLARQVAALIAAHRWRHWREKRRGAARALGPRPGCLHCGHVRPASPDIRTDVDGRPVCAFCLSDGLGGGGEELGLFRTYARDWRRWCWSCDQMAREGR
jgi:hypothetical protein